MSFQAKREESKAVMFSCIKDLLHRCKIAPSEVSPTQQPARATVTWEYPLRLHLHVCSALQMPCIAICIIHAQCVHVQSLTTSFTTSLWYAARHSGRQLFGLQPHAVPSSSSHQSISGSSPQSSPTTYLAWAAQQGSYQSPWFRNSLQVR